MAKWLIIGNEELLLKLHRTKIYEKSHMHTHKMSVKIQDVRNLLTPSKNLKRNKNAQLLARAKKDGYARFFPF